MLSLLFSTCNAHAHAIIITIALSKQRRRESLPAPNSSLEALGISPFTEELAVLLCAELSIDNSILHHVLSLLMAARSTTKTFSNAHSPISLSSLSLSSCLITPPRTSKQVPQFPPRPQSPWLAVSMDHSIHHGAPARGGPPRPPPASTATSAGLNASRFDQGARSNAAVQPGAAGGSVVLKKKAIKIATGPRPQSAQSSAASVSSATLMLIPPSPVPSPVKAQPKELNG